MARLSQRESPLLTTRRLLTVGLLCTSLVIVLVAQRSFSRPAAWRWITGTADSSQVTASSADSHRERDGIDLAVQSELTRACLLVGQSSTPCLTPAAASTSMYVSWASEYVPLTTATSHRSRRAPYPDPNLLAGAADSEAFLFPPADALPEFQASAKAAGDARARYHLLQLAQDATPGSLDVDARRGVRYESLRQKPDNLRGEVVTVTGTLVSLAAPMELHGRLPGLDVCYLGHLVGDRPEARYLILFTDLPPALADQKAWSNLYVPNVTFSGYFYKVARFAEQTGKRREWSLPTLVGKSPHLPSVVADDRWPVILLVFATMAIPVVLIALILPRYFRRGQQEHERLMDRVRSRHDQHVIKDLEPPPALPMQDSKVGASDQISRLREGLSPTEWN